jgi:Protein of unknown function DUF262
VTDRELASDDMSDEAELEESDPADRLTLREENDLVAAEPTAATIAYSGQDFDVAGLVRRLRSEDILIPIFGSEDERISSAGFQRSFVWTRPQMDRFVESLLLGYPVPGIFLVRQADRRYLVLDGQQRLRTLFHFMDGVYAGKEFSLQNVVADFQGLTFKSLPDDLRRLLEDTFFQATIVSTDESPESLEAIYQIFERVNSGGTQLTPHEIRVALFAGPLIDYLEQLNRIPGWRTLYGRKSPRLRDQELILRIIALDAAAGEYRRPLKSFLNKIAGRFRYMEGLAADDVRDRFALAAQLIEAAGGQPRLRPGGTQLNAALTEALFVGLMRRLATSEIHGETVASVLQALAGQAALVDATSRATADEESVRTRLEIATSAFAQA